MFHVSPVLFYIVGFWIILKSFNVWISRMLLWNESLKEEPFSALCSCKGGLTTDGGTSTRGQNWEWDRCQDPASPPEPPLLLTLIYSRWKRVPECISRFNERVNKIYNSGVDAIFFSSVVSVSDLTVALTSLHMLSLLYCVYVVRSEVPVQNDLLVWIWICK